MMIFITINKYCYLKNFGPTINLLYAINVNENITMHVNQVSFTEKRGKNL